MPNSIEFPFSARYFDNGVATTDATEILFVFHGYGQLAEYFIRKFEVLKDMGIRVVAPEGLSRYYLQGSSGRVGASWMTREDRLTDIRNYLTYINKVYEIEIENRRPDQKLSVLGFSQGAATASRWVSQPGVDFDRFVLWAGLFPPDLEEVESREQFKNKEVIFVYGLNDPYLSDERFKEQRQISNDLKVEPQVITFDGVHIIDSSALEQIFK